ncbi:MAG: hypothetical protein PHI85_09215 [Victivallaceae bacterium]|nr:hypothetical protein [Victivallaceae bacterium]
MTSEEFSQITNGITAVKLGELTNKSSATIQAYASGARVIPYEVEMFANSLKMALSNIKMEKKMNERIQKKIIDGKLYNTATATMIAEYENGFVPGDFRYLCEELYRTKNGSFFLAGDGGAMTKYSRPCGNNASCGGENIFPLTEVEARKWCEEFCSAEEYIAAFGEPPEA